MNKFTIITSGDQNYFSFLERFEANVNRVSGTYPVIYDIGLGDKRRTLLKSQVEVMHEQSDFSGYTFDGFIKASHKAACVLHALQRHELVLMLDADILVTRMIEFPTNFLEEIDIAVTPRHPEEQYAELLKNGRINTGFMLFRSCPSVLEIVEKWAVESEKENVSDQLALSNILENIGVNFSGETIQNVEGIRVGLADPLLYNDVSLSTGIIRHYKNAARKPRSYKRYKIDHKLIKYSRHLLPISDFLWRVERFANRILK